MSRLLLLLSIFLLSAGCGRAKRTAGDAASAAAGATKAVAGKAGHAVGEHVGTFFAGVGEGVEQSVCDYETRVDDPALDLLRLFGEPDAKADGHDGELWF